LDRVVAEVWDTGYGHHIQRLMILANIATLLDCDPRELTDWFWVAFADAFDWVVEPNVLGMGSFAVGDLMTTKPYVSGAAYIDRMSDYCDGCRFDPARDCPITNLYWAFLDRHSSKLQNNPRLRLPLASLRKRSREKRRNDAAVFRHVSQTLAEGDQLSPDALPGQDSVDA
jgi:deoxyribodipyrimidine photolyase-related protein